MAHFTKEKIMSNETFNSVWDAIETDPVKAEKLKIQSDLMMSIVELVEKWNVTQTEAAKRLGVTQPRLNDLLQGRFNKFRIDGLIKMAIAGGLSIKVDVKKAPSRKPAKTRPAAEITLHPA